jgi:hypothetical protein
LEKHSTCRVGGAEGAAEDQAPRPYFIFSDGLRNAVVRIRVNRHRPKLHRHRTHHARTWLDLVAVAYFCLVALHDQHHFGPGYPVLAITLTLMALERAFGVGFFNPALGGDPLLFQHLFCSIRTPRFTL